MDVDPGTGGRSHVLWELVQTGHLAGRRFGEVFAVHGLTPAQYGILASVGDGDGLSQADLARAVLVRPQSITSLLDGLVTQGLLARTGRPGRGRRKTVSLTEEGRHLLDAARPAAYSLLTPQVIGLDETQTRTLTELLGLVRDQLQQADQSAGPDKPTKTKPTRTKPATLGPATLKSPGQAGAGR